jgi:hypothetical protein
MRNSILRGAPGISKGSRPRLRQAINRHGNQLGQDFVFAARIFLPLPLNAPPLGVSNRASANGDDSHLVIRGCPVPGHLDTHGSISAEDAVKGQRGSDDRRYFCIFRC